jgi:hypothetical protein
MNNEEIIEGNKLIAEFMGGTKTKSPGYLDRDYFDFKDKPYQKWTNLYGGSFEETTLYWEGDLKYHSDWNWLMPVIEKIEKVEFMEAEDANDPDACAFIRTFSRGMVRINRFTLHQANTLLEAAWQAVVDFIKWNNNQPK